ncbi:hypothetical protein [Streptomyces sp. CA-179760]|uniref:hypothetical protein n=1 Tax=Streptomyces sp. CA-179760 TaxID=3240054 RepID=UPI003D8D3F8A
MYLIHVHFKGPPSATLPEGVECLVRSSARVADRLEHVVAHGRARPYPVLGLYLVAERAEDARSRAHDMCIRMLRGSPSLHPDWEVVGAELPAAPPPGRWHGRGPLPPG